MTKAANLTGQGDYVSCQSSHPTERKQMNVVLSPVQTILFNSVLFLIQLFIIRQFLKMFLMKEFEFDERVGLKMG